MTVEPKSPKRRRLLHTILKITLIGVSLLIFAVVFELTRPISWLDFPPRRKTLEDRVRQIKGQNIAPGEDAWFHFGDKVISKRSWSNDDAYVYRLNDGKFIIHFITSFQNHAGVYGYIYSEVPLIMEEHAEQFTVPSGESTGHGPLWVVRQQVADNW